MDSTDEHIAFAVDLTQLKQAEAALQASQQRYRDLAEAMPQIVWTAEATGAVNYWNQRWYKYTGLSEAESMGLAGISTVHPDDRDRTLAQWSQSLAKGESFEIEYRIRRWDGTYRWFITRALPTRDGQGQITGWIGTITDIDDHKQSEASLRESQAQLQQQLAEIEAIYQSAPIGLNVLDRELRFVRINRRLADINGLPVEAHIGRTVRELLPELADTAEQLLRPILETGEDYAAEYRIRNADGAERWVIARGRVEYDANGNAIAVPGALADISDRKQTEEALRQSEERYRTLFESMEDGFCVIEMLFDENNKPLDYRFLEINPAFEQQTGLKQAEGKTARQLVPNLEEHWFEIYGRVALTGEPVRFENGSEPMNRWFDVYAFRIGQPESRKIAILFKDISDRKQAEEALRRSEDRLRMAIKSAQLGTWDWNLTTERLTWDAGCKAMFGLPPEAQTSIEVFFEALHPDAREPVERVIQRSLNPASGGNYDVEYRTIGIQDGIERWIAAKGQVYFDSAGKPQRFIGTVLDITERKQAEARREQLIEQEQAAREAAERANRIKDEFLAISHELRTPLNPILGWSRLLQTRKFNETKTAEALATIERNARLQIELIDDLLDVAKILRGKLNLKITSVNLSSAIAAAIETLEMAATAKSISLHQELPNIGRKRGTDSCDRADGLCQTRRSAACLRQWVSTAR